MLLARSHILATIALVAALMPGCLSAVKVPDDAELLWYGKPPIHFEAIPTSARNGQIYLFDDTAHKVVSVQPVADKSQFNSNGLKPDHDYGLYYLPKLPPPSLTAKPSTSFAQ